MRSRPQARYLPGDLVYYKRVKPPADQPANPMVGQKTWRWFGPGRVLATETRTDAGGLERRPHNVVWVVTGGRLKRCAPFQLRHASERERLIAEQVDSPVASWTFHSLLQGVQGGQYERFDNLMFPEDMERKRLARRGTSRARSRTPGRRSRSVPVGGDVSSGEEMMESRSRGHVRPPGDPSGERPPKEARVSKQEKKEETYESTQESQKLQTGRPGSSTVAHDRSQFSVEEVIDSGAMARGHGTTAAGETGELFEHDLFRMQRQKQERAEMTPVKLARRSGDSANVVLPEPMEKKLEDGQPVYFMEEDEQIVMDLPMPKSKKEWKLLERCPEAYYVKKIRNTEVNVRRLNSEQLAEFDKAKHVEVQSWVRNAAVRRAGSMVSTERCINMRWVLCYKESGAPKARIVLIGYQDPDVEGLATASPTMSRRTRQAVLQYKCCRKWRALKGDVRAAFLQGASSEEDRKLFAKPVPELACEMGLKEGECVQILKSCYGLITAPASWFRDVTNTLRKAGMEPLITDPCCWRFRVKDEMSGEMVTQGLVCAHVDDFIVVGNEGCEEWVDALTQFYHRYDWSDWEFGSFSHCGVILKENEDFSVTLDHASFVDNLEPVEFQNRDEKEQVTEFERGQIRGLLGALQWRCYNTAPQHAAKLSLLQSEICVATVATIKKLNKLLRECQAQRHISIKVNVLHCEPEEVNFVGWCDAALGNRPGNTSTGGYVIAATSPKMLRNEPAPLSIMAWRSGRLPRVARSSLGAELQAMSECEEELMFLRFQWAEMCGHEAQPGQVRELLAKVPGALVTDAKALYDVVKKGTMNSAGAGLKEKYSTMEFLSLIQRLSDGGTEIRWVHSDAQLADALTKGLTHGGALQKVLVEGKWTIVHDPLFTAAKKRAKGTE